jgi:hypothetical protein
MAEAAPAAAPAAPEIPGTPTEAATRLAERRADRSWGEKLISQDASTVAEFHALAKKASEGNDLDLMILAAPDMPDLNIDGTLSPKKIAGEIGSLRESGLSDDVIKELLTGRTSTVAEVDAVKRFKAMRHSSKEWVDRYLAGDHDARRESMLMSMVLMQAPS